MTDLLEVGFPLRQTPRASMPVVTNSLRS